MPRKRTLTKGERSAYQEMNYRQLVKAVEADKISEKQLREYYSYARKKELDRQYKFAKSEFAEEKELSYHPKLKNITTLQQLVHEIADVNRELNRKNNTVAGYRQQREKAIEIMQEKGIPVSSGNYGAWTIFLKWFNNSSWSAIYDSDSEEVIAAFEEAPSGSAQDWERLIMEMSEEMTE